MLTENQTQLDAPAQIALPRQPAGNRHFHTVDAMRGIAALSVCWFHFTNAQFTEQFGAYRSSGSYGWLGVQVFFVISGFIIPFSLFRARYRIQSFFRFLSKRVTRLDPPYLASVFLVVAGLWVSSLLPGHHPYQVPWHEVLAHLGYVNAFLGMPWLQMSYWSLAIEFQYYIFVGLCYPLLASRSRIAPVLILVVFGAVALLSGHNIALLPHYLPLFAIGIFAFRHICLKTPLRETLCAVLLATALTAGADGIPDAVVAMASCGAILFMDVNVGILNFFGDISYSLYLMHVFVGNLVFGLALRYSHNSSSLKWVLPFFALAVAIAVACALHWLVETPSRRWASRIRYSPN